MKSIALLLTGTLVWSQVVPPLAQAKVWEDRRPSFKERPPSPPPSSPGPRPHSGNRFSNLQQDLTTHLAMQIPPQLGRVVERFQGRPGQPLLIHLQDAHGHVVGQWHLAHLLHRLTRMVPQRPLVVGVEGAWAPMDTDWLASFPDDRIKRDLATALLRRGELHGEEYLALTAPPKTIRLVGVDDPTLYQQNQEAKSALGEAVRRQVFTALTHIENQLAKQQRHTPFSLPSPLEGEGGRRPGEGATESSPTTPELWSRWVSLQRKLWSFELTPAEYAEHQSLKGQVSWEQVLRRFGTAPSPSLDLPTVTAAIAQVEQFYQLAKERDTVLVEQMLHELRATEAHMGVLIAGGFHTPGVTRRLREQGVSYLVAQPNLLGTPPPDPGILIERQGAAFQQAVHTVLGTLRATATLDTPARTRVIALKLLALFGLENQHSGGVSTPASLTAVGQWLKAVNSQHANAQLHLGTVASHSPSSQPMTIVAWTSAPQENTTLGESSPRSDAPRASIFAFKKGDRQFVLSEHIGPIELEPTPRHPIGQSTLRDLLFGPPRGIMMKGLSIMLGVGLILVCYGALLIGVVPVTVLATDNQIQRNESANDPRLQGLLNRYETRERRRRGYPKRGVNPERDRELAETLDQDLRLIRRVFQFAYHTVYNAGTNKEKKFPFGKQVTYLNHALGTARHAIQWGANATTVAVALLHKAEVETWGDNQHERIRHSKEPTSPPLTTALAHALAEDPQLAQSSAKATEIVQFLRNFNEISLTPFLPGRTRRDAISFVNQTINIMMDAQVLRLVLADKLHTLKCLEGHEGWERRFLADEILRAYVPMAHRFGLRSVADQLREVALQIGYPEHYQATEHAIAKIIGGAWVKPLEMFKRYVQQIQEELQAFLDAYSAEEPERPKVTVKVTWRRKSTASTLQKLHRHLLKRGEEGHRRIEDLPLELIESLVAELWDLWGISTVFEGVEHLEWWETVQGTLQRILGSVDLKQGREDLVKKSPIDWIFWGAQTSFGRIEIQARTAARHQKDEGLAVRGPDARWVYELQKVVRKREVIDPEFMDVELVPVGEYGEGLEENFKRVKVPVERDIYVRIPVDPANQFRPTAIHPLLEKVNKRHGKNPTGLLAYRILRFQRPVAAATANLMDLVTTRQIDMLPHDFTARRGQLLFELGKPLQFIPVEGKLSPGYVLQDGDFIEVTPDMDALLPSGNLYRDSAIQGACQTAQRKRTQMWGSLLNDRLVKEAAGSWTDEEWKTYVEHRVSLGTTILQSLVSELKATPPLNPGEAEQILQQWAREQSFFTDVTGIEGMRDIYLWLAAGATVEHKQGGGMTIQVAPEKRAMLIRVIQQTRSAMSRGRTLLADAGLPFLNDRGVLEALLKEGHDKGIPQFQDVPTVSQLYTAVGGGELTVPQLVACYVGQRGAIVESRLVSKPGEPATRYSVTLYVLKEESYKLKEVEGYLKAMGGQIIEKEPSEPDDTIGTIKQTFHVAFSRPLSGDLQAYLQLWLQGTIRRQILFLVSQGVTLDELTDALRSSPYIGTPPAFPKAYVPTGETPESGFHEFRFEVETPRQLPAGALEEHLEGVIASRHLSERVAVEVKGQQVIIPFLPGSVFLMEPSLGFAIIMGILGDTSAAAVVHLLLPLIEAVMKMTFVGGTVSHDSDEERSRYRRLGHTQLMELGVQLTENDPILRTLLPRETSPVTTGALQAVYEAVGRGALALTEVLRQYLEAHGAIIARSRQGGVSQPRMLTIGNMTIKYIDHRFFIRVGLGEDWKIQSVVRFLRDHMPRPPYDGFAEADLTEEPDTNTQRWVGTLRFTADEKGQIPFSTFAKLKESLGDYLQKIVAARRRQSERWNITFKIVTTHTEGLFRFPKASPTGEAKEDLLAARQEELKQKLSEVLRKASSQGTGTFSVTGPPKVTVQGKGNTIQSLVFPVRVVPGTTKLGSLLTQELRNDVAITNLYNDSEQPLRWFLQITARRTTGLLVIVLLLALHPGWTLFVPLTVHPPAAPMAAAATTAQTAYKPPPPWPSPIEIPTTDTFRRIDFKDRTLWFHKWVRWLFDSSGTLPTRPAIAYKETTSVAYFRVVFPRAAKEKRFTFTKGRAGHVIGLQPLHHTAGGVKYKGIEIFDLTTNELIRSVYRKGSRFVNRYPTKKVKLRRSKDKDRGEYRTATWQGLPIHLGSRFKSGRERLKLQVDKVTGAVTNIFTTSQAIMPRSVIHSLWNPHWDPKTRQPLAVYLGAGLIHPPLKRASGRLQNVLVMKDQYESIGKVTVGPTTWLILPKELRGQRVDLLLENGVPIAAYRPGASAPSWFPKVIRVGGRPVVTAYGKLSKERYPRRSPKPKSIENLPVNEKGRSNLAWANIVDEPLGPPSSVGERIYASVVVERDPSGRDFPILSIWHTEATLQSPFTISGYQGQVVNVDILPPFDEEGHVDFYKTFRDPKTHRLNAQVTKPISKVHIPDDWILWEATTPWLVTTTIKKRGVVALRREFSTGWTDHVGDPVEVEYYPEALLVIISRVDGLFGQVLESQFYYGDNYERMHRDTLPPSTQTLLRQWDRQRTEWETTRRDAMGGRPYHPSGREPLGKTAQPPRASLAERLLEDAGIEIQAGRLTKARELLNQVDHPSLAYPLRERLRERDTELRRAERIQRTLDDVEKLIKDAGRSLEDAKGVLDSEPRNRNDRPQSWYTVKLYVHAANDQLAEVDVPPYGWAERRIEKLTKQLDRLTRDREALLAQTGQTSSTRNIVRVRSLTGGMVELTHLVISLVIIGLLTIVRWVRSRLAVGGRQSWLSLFDRHMLRAMSAWTQRSSVGQSRPAGVIVVRELAWPSGAERPGGSPEERNLDASLDASFEHRLNSQLVQLNQL